MYTGFEVAIIKTLVSLIYGLFILWGFCKMVNKKRST